MASRIGTTSHAAPLILALAFAALACPNRDFDCGGEVVCRDGVCVLDL